MLERLGRSFWWSWRATEGTSYIAVEQTAGSPSLAATAQCECSMPKLKEDVMRPTIGTLVITLAVGAVLGTMGNHIVAAQQASERRTVLLTSDLAGIDGYELRMWRTDIGPGVVGAKHYHPGTECIYVLEGALDLEKQGEASAHLKAGDAHCVPPKTVLVPRNASSTEPYKSLIVMIAPKGQPLAVPVK